MSIGERIKSLRKAKKLTQSELGEIFKLNYGAISAMESDRSMPRTEVLIEMSKYFNVSVDYIIFGTDTETTISLDEQAIIDMYRKDNQVRDVLHQLADLKKKVILTLSEKLKCPELAY